LKNRLQSDGVLEEVGGIFYLMELSKKVASDANIEYHAQVIHEKWIRRQVINTCSEAISAMYGDTDDTFDTHSALVKSLEMIEPKTDELTNAMDLIPEISKEIEAAIRGESSSLKLGYRDIDEEYAFDFKEYVVIAGDSGTGKTTFMVQVAKQMRRMYKNVPIIFNARDMDSKKVISRDLASEIEVSQMRFRTGKGIDGRHFERINARAMDYNGIYMCCEFTAAGLRAKVRKIRKQLNIPQEQGIVVINDYLQIGDSNGSSREQVVAGSSLEDKSIAIKENVLMIDLSQVNESAGKARPNHKSIRESRAPYHHADWVIFLYSPSKNEELRYENGDSTEGIIEAIFDKVRCGRPGNIIKLSMTSFGKITDYGIAGDLKFPTIEPNRKYFNEAAHSDEQPFTPEF
jgi:replicative DNA helicase